MTWTLGLIVLASAALREDNVAIEVAPDATLKTETALVQTKELRTNDPDMPMACSDSLVGQSTISASSSAEGKGPLMSIQDAEIDHAWEPVVSTKTQWIEWAWDKAQEIHFMQTAGLENMQKMGGVRKFKLEYADKNGDWIFYVSSKDKDAGKSWTTFVGTANAGEPKMNALDPPLQSMHLRLWPTDWNKKIAVRAGVRGCVASTVGVAEMNLAVKYSAIVPAKFEKMGFLRKEMRLRLADSMKIPVDMVQIMNVQADPIDPAQTQVKVHVLPKNGQTSPISHLTALGAVLGDENSELFKWMQDVEATEEHQLKTCADNQCGSHGDCAGGQCFCTESYTGANCEKKNGEIDYTHLAAAQAGEANAAGTIHDLNPLPVIEDAAQLPQGTNEKPVESALDAEITQLGEGSREGEEGISGKSHRHKTILFIPILLIVACIVVAGTVTKSKKTKKAMADQEAD